MTGKESAELLAFLLLAVNPIGGLLAAIPFALLKLGYSPWLVVFAGVPLSYVQVIVVDTGWTVLEKLGWWRRLIERSRGKWAQRLVSSRGSFWVTYLATPILGPWLVMALMRWAAVPQRVVGPPIFLSQCTASLIIALLCVLIPTLFD